MRIAILGNDQQKEEWLFKGLTNEVALSWVSNKSDLLEQEADAYFNLLFESGGSNLDGYANNDAPVFLNQVIHPFKLNEKRHAALFRLNAWPGFLKREIIELSAADPGRIQMANDVMIKLGWNYKWVPDIPGLITARVIATVINEAYFTLQQEVSSKEEIDIAMKLGTNYPYGPFEWSEIIGLEKIYQLLIEMSRSSEKYLPAELLRTEAEQKMTWH